MIEEFATDDGDRSDRKYRMIVRCINLVVSSKTLTQKNGLFTNIMNMSTGNSNLKNEKRYICMFQSEPVRGGNTTASLAFEQFYQSEIIEDSATVSPSLVAELSCAQDAHIKIKLTVMYSSNLATKEICLCHGVFNFDDLLKQHNGVLELPLASEHNVVGAKAFVEVLAPMR